MNLRLVPTTLLVLLAATLPGFGDFREIGQDELRELTRTGESRQLSEVLPKVQARVPGQILGVRTFIGNGV